MSVEEHERNTMVENLVWEAAKKIKPNSYINPKNIKKIYFHLLLEQNTLEIDSSQK